MLVSPTMYQKTETVCLIDSVISSAIDHCLTENITDPVDAKSYSDWKRFGTRRFIDSFKIMSFMYMHVPIYQLLVP